MAPDGMNGSESRDSGHEMVNPIIGPAIILQIARRMAEAGRARLEGIPSYETRAWLVGLARRTAFADATTGRAPAPDLLLANLARLADTAGSGPVGDLLVGTLRSFPLGRPDAPAMGHERLYLTALVLLLGSEPPTAMEVRGLMQGFAALAGCVDRRTPDGLGLRFLALATEFAIGIRCDGPPAMLARQMHDLGALAGRGAGAMLLALDAAEQREERIRAALSDPAFAMRMHARVPRRSMTAGGAESVRKQFNLKDPLADRARLTLQEAESEVAALRGDIVMLNALQQHLQAEAEAILTTRR